MGGCCSTPRCWKAFINNHNIDFVGESKLRPPTGNPWQGMLQRLCNTHPWYRDGIPRLQQHSPELNSFLLELERRDEMRQSSALKQQITTEFQAIIKSTFERLSEKHPGIFGGSVVHLVGSVGEGTKVGLQDEFDFMIELPALEMSLKHELLQGGYTGEIMQTFRRFDKDIENRSLKVEGEKLMREEMDLVLVEDFPRWKWKPTLIPLEFKDNAVAKLVGLRYFPPASDEHIDVFCDVVFSIPMTLSETGHRGKAIHKKVYFIDKDFGYRQSRIFEERRELENAAAWTGMQRVYRMVKILTRDTLPPVYTIEKDKLENPIPSYWLKQIIIYIGCGIIDPESWREEFLGLRVVEVILWFQKCLEEFPSINLAPEIPMFKFSNRPLIEMCISVLAELLTRANQGEESARRSLSCMCDLTTAFRDIVYVKARLIRVAYVLWPVNEFTDYEKLQKYAEDNLKGVLQLCTVNNKWEIRLRDKITDQMTHLSPQQYIHQYMDETTLSRFSVECRHNPYFADEWEEIYDQMFKQQLLNLGVGPSQSESRSRQLVGSSCETTIDSADEDTDGISAWIRQWGD